MTDRSGGNPFPDNNLLQKDYNFSHYRIEQRFLCVVTTFFYFYFLGISNNEGSEAMKMPRVLSITAGRGFLDVWKLRPFVACNSENKQCL